ncbi:MAG TPA: hypothetical protein VF121_14105 [Thermoanaerobaculia bacterium]|nr:hypothetical protein [Thermoanaerobaculia bacterium]
MGRKLGVLLAAATLAACARPSPRTAEEVFELDSFRWRAEATPQGVIVATNEWGDLRVRTAHRGGLVVSAMVQKIGAARDELEIRVDEAADAVVVKVVPRVAEPRGRVDLTLIVPPGKRLEGATGDGLAEIKYKGDVVARTRRGNILIETDAHASAQSETGTIVAKLSGGAWERALSFASGSGDITLWLPENANAVLRAATGGVLEVGFPHAAGSGGRETPRVETTLGHGGPELRIDSVSGDVRVVPWSRPAETRAAPRP